MTEPLCSTRSPASFAQGLRRNERLKRFSPCANGLGGSKERFVNKPFHVALVLQLSRRLSNSSQPEFLPSRFRAWEPPGAGGWNITSRTCGSLRASLGTEEGLWYGTMLWEGEEHPFGGVNLASPGPGLDPPELQCCGVGGGVLQPRSTPLAEGPSSARGQAPPTCPW